MTIVGTGDGWTSGASHVLAADLIEGQHEDRRLVVDGWDLPGYDARDWDAVEVLERGHDHLVASPAPPVRAVEELRPVSVITVRPGVQVVDLGQNVNGWVRLTDLGPAGTELTLTHGEALGADGDLTIEHLELPLRCDAPSGRQVVARRRCDPRSFPCIGAFPGRRLAKRAESSRAGAGSAGPGRVAGAQVGPGPAERGDVTPSSMLEGGVGGDLDDNVGLNADDVDVFAAPVADVAAADDRRPRVTVAARGRAAVPACDC